MNIARHHAEGSENMNIPDSLSRLSILPKRFSRPSIYLALEDD